MCLLVIYKVFMLKDAHNFPHILLHVCLCKDATQILLLSRLVSRLLRHLHSDRTVCEIIQIFAGVCVCVCELDCDSLTGVTSWRSAWCCVAMASPHTIKGPATSRRSRDHTHVCTASLQP